MFYQIRLLSVRLTLFCFFVLRNRTKMWLLFFYEIRTVCMYYTYLYSCINMYNTHVSVGLLFIKMNNVDDLTSDAFRKGTKWRSLHANPLLCQPAPLPNISDVFIFCTWPYYRGHHWNMYRTSSFYDNFGKVTIFCQFTFHRALYTLSSVLNSIRHSPNFPPCRTERTYFT